MSVKCLFIVIIIVIIIPHNKCCRFACRSRWCDFDNTCTGQYEWPGHKAGHARIRGALHDSTVALPHGVTGVKLLTPVEDSGEICQHFIHHWINPLPVFYNSPIRKMLCHATTSPQPTTMTSRPTSEATPTSPPMTTQTMKSQPTTSRPSEATPATSPPTTTSRPASAGHSSSETDDVLVISITVPVSVIIFTIIAIGVCYKRFKANRNNRENDSELRNIELSPISEPSPAPMHPALPRHQPLIPPRSPPQPHTPPRSPPPGPRRSRRKRRQPHRYSP